MNLVGGSDPDGEEELHTQDVHPSILRLGPELCGPPVRPRGPWSLFLTGPSHGTFDLLFPCCRCFCSFTKAPGHVSRLLTPR